LIENSFSGIIVAMTLKKKTGVSDLRVIELFAGVGGFRVGLEGYGKRKLKGYKTVWNNQWEPATKKQHASEVYVARFGNEGHSNEDIAKVLVRDIPDHDLLVGGFPCQDYSVARTLSQAAGIHGKKGVLWWEIHRILTEKGTKAPKYLMLENVDRLLKSPASQRGKDFAVMLASLNDLGYILEWRVVNAADYGMPQRRRRTFMIGYKKGSATYKKIKQGKNTEDWLLKSGVTAKAFPILKPESVNSFEIEGDLADITAHFNKKTPDLSPFKSAGISIDRQVITCEAKPNYNGKRVNLGDILQDDKDVPEEFFIKESDLKQWKYLKGAKKEERSGRDGFTFFYVEGPMVFPDGLDKPSRTIITAEGGATPSRFKHVVMTPSGKHRRLTPLELERLCMFPDNHTAGQPDVKRAFFMGNALVVGVIERLGRALLKEVV